jgi:Transposase and inactivated derivatives, IS30 family
MRTRKTSLDLEDRKQIEAYYTAGARVFDIAIHFGFHSATIYEELKRGYTGEYDVNGRPGYSASKAEKTSIANLSRRGRIKVAKTVTVKRCIDPSSSPLAPH